MIVAGSYQDPSRVQPVTTEVEFRESASRNPTTLCCGNFRLRCYNFDDIQLKRVLNWRQIRKSGIKIITSLHLSLYSSRQRKLPEGRCSSPPQSHLMSVSRNLWTRFILVLNCGWSCILSSTYGIVLLPCERFEPQASADFKSILEYCWDPEHLVLGNARSRKWKTLFFYLMTQESASFYKRLNTPVALWRRQLIVLGRRHD